MIWESFDISFADWMAENLRLSLFHHPREPNPGLWESLFSVRPESLDERPREKVLSERGVVNESVVALISQVDRLDWHFQPNPRSENDRGGLLILTNVEGAVTSTRKALDVSLAELGKVDRIALGVTLAQRVADIDTGMDLLSKYLPDMDMSRWGGADFIYQVNRRGRSGQHPHVLLNRIVKWSLDEYLSGNVRITAHRGPQLSTSGPLHAARLTMDINTSTNNNAISTKKMPDLLSEFFLFAQQVSAGGGDNGIDAD